MDRHATALEEYTTSEDACRSLASFGVAWDAAIEFGIDVTLLVENVRMSVWQRIARMDERNCFAAEIQRRTVSAGVRGVLARRELAEKRRALDPDP